MRTRLHILFLITTVILSGCNDNSAEYRLRTALNIPSSTNISEAVVTEKLKSIIQIGTSEPEIAEIVGSLGIGKDNLSSYLLSPNRRSAVVRIEYDPTTFGMVKSTWIITLYLDSSMKLSSVVTKRYLTGL